MRTVKWFIALWLMLLQIQFSLCHRKFFERLAATDEFYRMPKLTDPTNQQSLYLIDSGRLYKLVKRVDEKGDFRTAYRTDHQSGGQFDKSPELIDAIQLMAESDLQSNYLEHNQVDKASSSGYPQTDYHMDDNMDQHSNDYYRYSTSYQPNGHSSKPHRPYSSHNQHHIKPHRPYKPIYVTDPGKVNPLLILSQDTIRLQEEILLGILPHFLRSHLIGIMDGHMGKLKGSKNTQYDPDHAWFGGGILVKTKKRY